MNYGKAETYVHKADLKCKFSPRFLSLFHFLDRHQNSEFGPKPWKPLDF